MRKIQPNYIGKWFGPASTTGSLQQGTNTFKKAHKTKEVKEYIKKFTQLEYNNRESWKKFLRRERNFILPIAFSTITSDIWWLLASATCV